MSKPLIKKLIRENLLRENLEGISQQVLTPEYFKKRIPFLQKVQHEVEYENGVQIFTHQTSHSKVQIAHENLGIIKFKEFITGVNFEYTRSKVSGSNNVEHIFKLKPTLRMDIDSQDKTFKLVNNHAIRRQMEEIGVYETVELPKGADIPKDKLDSIINEMNKTFFVFEEFLEGFGVTM